MGSSTRNIDTHAKAMFAYFKSDGAGFRRAARTLQSIWRERDHDLPMGEHNGHPLGSRLPVDMAERELCNYLTPGIRSVVREELAAAKDSQLFSKPCIYNDLLSSQPLCFNLFGELKLDLDLATTVMGMLFTGQVSKVTGIRFGYSPGRSSERFTGDRSAFDVFVEYDVANGGKGFLGIEVKYHENLKEPAAPHRLLYDEVATKMSCFQPDKLSNLRLAPLQQFWRDHLLAGSMLCDRELGYQKGNLLCYIQQPIWIVGLPFGTYRDCLSRTATFDAWTLEEFAGIF